MATSAAFERRASAHCDGTVNESSNLPCNGPWVNPRTSGAVLRYCTTEMRSLLTKRDSRFSAIIAELIIARRVGKWCKTSVPDGGFEHDETDARHDIHPGDFADCGGIFAVCRGRFGARRGEAGKK